PIGLLIFDCGILTHLSSAIVFCSYFIQSSNSRIEMRINPMANAHLKLVTPSDEKRTVTPRRQKNAEVRTREHLMPREITALINPAKCNRYGHRDATMIMISYQHGLRVSEVCDLRWDQIDFDTAVLHVRRIKNGLPSTHPLQGDELRALRRLRRESAPSP